MYLGLVVLQPVGLVHHQTGPVDGAQDGHVDGDQLVGGQQDVELDGRVFLLDQIETKRVQTDCKPEWSETQFALTGGSRLTFILEAFFPPRMALSSKENSFSLMTARLSLSPTYVTTYMSGAHISNSLSQLMMVESGALTRKGPLECP